MASSREEDFFRKMKEQKEAEAAAMAKERQDKLAAMGEDEREEFLQQEADAAVQKKKAEKHLKVLAKASGKKKINLVITIGLPFTREIHLRTAFKDRQFTSIPAKRNQHPSHHHTMASSFHDNLLHTT